MQSSTIRLHSQSAVHQLAVAAWYSPPGLQDLPAGLGTDDAQLFKGGVPQVADIVRLFRWMNSPVSFQVMSNLTLTESFLSQQRVDVTRKAAASMVKILCESIRQKKLHVLRQSRSLCLIFDERSPHTVLRYRSDVAERFGHGILKAWAVSTPMTDELEDDWSKRRAAARPASGILFLCRRPGCVVASVQVVARAQ